MFPVTDRQASCTTDPSNGRGTFALLADPDLHPCLPEDLIHVVCEEVDPTHGEMLETIEFGED